jgi:transcriptional regulator with XRE-family HTH domain
MKKQIGNVLRKYREEKKGLTQAEVAKKVSGKEDPGYIGRIERGENAPSIKYIEKLLKIYETDPIQFFSDVELEYIKSPPKPPKR